ncbi:MAG: QacE family quaternary ammonium compound efflux SMR transporter [Pseudolabrys sp.]|nr:QacE family quaternary ammonium compound efflux SMR transporter [Pseudolabrys sp.]
MHWIYLGAAVVFEVAVALAAGNAKGFSHLGWTAATLVCGAIATVFLSFALLTFDVGVGYAMWTSIAGVGIAVLGAVFFGQRLGLRKIAGIALVIGGVVGLRLSGAA